MVIGKVVCRVVFRLLNSVRLVSCVLCFMKLLMFYVVLVVCLLVVVSVGWIRGWVWVML